MLATIPAMGFGCAAAILLYGLLVEGLGTKGAVWSVSVLDQAAGRVATAASRTLYAGVSPDEVRPSPGTVLRTGTEAPPGTVRLGWSHRSDDDRPLDLDLDRGAVGGQVVPARTPTALGTVSQGPSRARLRLRRRDDGRYDVLADERFAPAAARGSVVARLADGRWLASDETGLVLEETSEEAAADLLEKVRRAVPGRHPELLSTSTTWRADPTPSGSYTTVEVDGPGRLFPRWVGEATDAPPSAPFYLARFASVPFLDPLGLDVDWRSAEHVVLGLLGPDDVVEAR
jgi:hypothetical protein